MKYRVEIHAYQEIEIDAENDDDAYDKSLVYGIDLSSCEWSIEKMYKKENNNNHWEEVR